MSASLNTAPIATAVDKRGTGPNGARIRARYDVLDATEHRVLVRYVGHINEAGQSLNTTHESTSAPVWLSRARFRVFWGEKPW